MGGFRADLTRFIISTLVLTACALGLAIYVHDSVNGPEDQNSARELLLPHSDEQDRIETSQATSQSDDDAATDSTLAHVTKTEKPKKPKRQTSSRQ